MMSKVNCPLCKSSSTIFLETINASEIEKQYEKAFGIKVNLMTQAINYYVCNDCRLGFFDPMVSGDENLYEELQKIDWYYMSKKPEYEIAIKHLPDSGLILEVGSGKAAFAAAVGNERYVGLEFNDDAVKRAEKNGITLIKESVEKYATENISKYQAVVSFQVLEHVSNPLSFIQGCIDTLKSGGQFIIAVPNHNGICGLTQNHLLDLPPHHVTHWSTSTLKELSSLFNLELLSIDKEPIAEYHMAGVKHTLWENRLRNILGMKRTLLDKSITARIVSRIALIFSKWFPISSAGINGHTVVATYRKK